jgi:hypothetical protein
MGDGRVTLESILSVFFFFTLTYRVPLLDCTKLYGS